MNKTNYKDSEAWIIRNCFCFDTLETEFYLDEKNKIVWLSSEYIKEWKTIWENSNIVLTKGFVANIVKDIIEKWKYESIMTLLEELNIAYNQRINRIVANNPDNLIIYEEAIAA